MIADRPSLAAPPPDVPSLVRGRYVAIAGRFASVSREQMRELIESYDGKCVIANRLGIGIGLLVIGQRDWPLEQDGTLTECLRRVRVRMRQSKLAAPVILCEDDFLDAMGRGGGVREEEGRRLFTASTLSELLEVPRERLAAWVKAGLIEPERTEHGVHYFDFRQVTAARTLCDLWRRGVPLGRLRRSLRQLKELIPALERPFEQLAAIEHNGDLLIRLESGDLSAADGQLMLEFDPASGESEGDDHAGHAPMRLVPAGPTTAHEWHEQGIEQHRVGLVREAVESYREALRLGGPNATTCFDLARGLQLVGRRQEALERYFQATEIQPNFADAWNNIGLLLCETARREAACTAFRRALAADPHHAAAHYNLADTLNDLHLHAEAAEHWRAYLRYDQSSDRAHYARTEIAALATARG